MDPHDALLFTVRLAAGAVAYLRQRIEELEDREVGELTKADIALSAMYSEMYGAERDRLAKSAKLAIDAGIDERRIQLEEEQGELIARTVQAILADLNLTAEQKREAPSIARKHLTLLASAS